MELRQLKYFAKLAETLNFSDAARQLFISQSTLSQQIKQLEQELNTQLFQRDNHKVTLTEPGRRCSRAPSIRSTPQKPAWTASETCKNCSWARST